MTRLNVLTSMIASLVVIACAVIPIQEPSPSSLWPDCATGEGNINNASVIIPKDSVDLDLFAGALIGAFTPDGDCIGAEYWSGADNFSFTIWGADAESPDPRGADEGEAFELRLLNEITPIVEADAVFTYTENGLYRVTSAEYPISGDASAQIQQLEDEVDALTAERDALVSENATLTDERDSARQSRDNLQAQVDALTAERDALQTQLADEQAVNATLSDQIDQAVAILTGAQ